MSWIRYLLVASVGMFIGSASAEEHGRIKRKPPMPAEAERIASETVMNDSMRRRGDIVVTDRGFFFFRGSAADGISNDFVAVSNPVVGARR